MFPVTFYGLFPPRQIRLGQWIKVGGAIQHHGIVYNLVRDPITNTVMCCVAHTTWPGGVTVTTLDEFAQGRKIEIVGEPKSINHQNWILRAAEANMGKQYSVFSGNCEHFASFCFNQKAESNQLQMGAVMAALIIGSFVISSAAGND